MNLSDIEVAIPAQSILIENYRNHFDDFDAAVKRSGVSQKYVAAENETALDLAFLAFKQLEKKTPGVTSSIDGIIFITQTPDYFLPGNSYLLMKQLNLDQDIVNYDLNQGCAGFIVGTQLARSMMLSNQASKIAVIFSDTYSKLIGDDDRGTKLLFGDGCAIAIFDNQIGPYKVCASKTKQLSRYCDFFITREGAARDNYQSSAPTIDMKGAALLAVLSANAPDFLNDFLTEQKLNFDDIDLVVCHQASGVALDMIQKALGIPTHKMFRNLEFYGNTTCASIPIALNEALFEDSTRKPKRVLVFGFGVGFVMGVQILEIGTIC